MQQEKSDANTIWLEKYRPKTLDEVHGNSDMVDKLRAIVQMGNLPNLILGTSGFLIKPGPPESEKRAASSAWPGKCWESRSRTVSWS